MRKTFAFVLFLLMTAAFPATALAADPLPNNILVSLWPEYSNSQVFFMQQISLPPDTVLPTVVRFAYPTGTQIQWTGEILGSDTAQDIAATPTITQKDGYDEVAVTLTKSRTAQAEAIWDGLKISGKNRTLTLDWVQRYPSMTTTFEFMEPSQSSNIIMTPVQSSTRKSPEGFTYHMTSPKVLAVGQSEPFTITYARAITTPSVNDANAAGQTTGQTTGTAQNPINIWVVAAIFLVVGIGISIFVYRESQNK